MEKEMTVLERLASSILVPVVVIENEDDADGLAKALIEGGLPVAEVTFRTAAAAGAIKAMSKYPEILLGAGTVLSVEQVDAAVEAGASYIVSPGLSKAVVERAQELGVAVLPGATTATEIQAALELGINTVKFFPAGTSGGPKAIAALAAPFVDVTFVPTGGVSASNLADYLAIDRIVAVGGSWMVPSKLITEHKFDEIRDLVSEAVELAQSIRPAH